MTKKTLYKGMCETQLKDCPEKIYVTSNVYTVNRWNESQCFGHLNQKIEN